MKQIPDWLKRLEAKQQKEAKYLSLLATMMPWQLSPTQHLGGSEGYATPPWKEDGSNTCLQMDTNGMYINMYKYTCVYCMCYVDNTVIPM